MRADSWRPRTLPLVALLLACMLTGCTTFDRDDKPLQSKFSPRWAVNEVPYEEVGRAEQVGRNVRDGLTGIVDNVVQGAASGFMIAGTTGYLVQKGATILGDVIGLIDDNDYTEHVFKGVISKQFLKFGAQANGMLPALSGMHEYTFQGEPKTVLDYVGPERFHTKVYGRPSGVTTLVGVVAADFLIRPTGNLVMIFGGRETGEKIDKFGLELIQTSTEIPFL
jgi:hypothetical protein